VRRKRRRCPTPKPMKPRFSKTMIMFVLVLGICSGMHPGAYAQAQSGAVTSPRRLRRGLTLEDQVRNLTRTLDLDSTQQDKLKAILEYRQIRLRRVYENKSLSAVDRFSALKTVHERSDDQIRHILNPEQASKFEQFRHGALPQTQPKPE
jgi:Spy/CpxP family protein refolding chaperone